MTKSIRPLSGVTLKAIELFWKIEKYQANIERLEDELSECVVSIPRSEMNYFVNKTNVNSRI